eukprot:1159973-Pelagomonas_calceolata.AAC.6
MRWRAGCESFLCTPVPSQGNRLKRELERVTEERDRAREEGKRAEQLRQQLELELKNVLV